MYVPTHLAAAFLASLSHNHTLPSHVSTEAHILPSHALTISVPMGHGPVVPIHSTPGYTSPVTSDFRQILHTAPSALVDTFVTVTVATNHEVPASAVPTSAVMGNGLVTDPAVDPEPFLNGPGPVIVPGDLTKSPSELPTPIIRHGNARSILIPGPLPIAT